MSSERPAGTTRALVRLGRFAAGDALPALRRGVAWVRGTADELAIRMLGRDFEERLRRVPLQVAHDGIDPFGLHLDTAKYACAVAAFLHRIYFRTEVSGIERVPPGAVLLVANHSGQLPLDAVVIGASLFLDAEPPRLVRSMVEKWAQGLPFVSTFFQRVGQVVGVPDNARLLLAQGEALLVFPEGARGIAKPFRERYQMTEFGLGFMRLAMETHTPIVPIAVVGGEEQYVNVGNIEPLARLLGMPVFPVVPQWFLPGGQLPLPTKYRLYFGEPLRFEGDPDDEDAAIAEKVALVKAAIDRMLRRGLATRRGVFW